MLVPVTTVTNYYILNVLEQCEFTLVLELRSLKWVCRLLAVSQLYVPIYTSDIDYYVVSPSDVNK